MTFRSTYSITDHNATENLKAMEEDDRNNISHRNTPHNECSLSGDSGDLQESRNSHRNTEIEKEVRSSKSTKHFSGHRNMLEREEKSVLEMGRRIRYNPYKIDGKDTPWITKNND